MEIFFALIYIFCGFVIGFAFFYRRKKKPGRSYVVNSGGQDQLVPLLSEIMADQIPFSKATFTRATYITALKHLRKEIDEVIAADELPFTDPNNGSLMEYADCFILLMDSFWRRHPEFSDGDKLLVAVWNKIQINKARTWQAPNADGFVEHVRETSISNALRNMTIKPTPRTLEKIQAGEFLRADGDCSCPACGLPYKLHPRIEGYEWLNHICDGMLVKL